MADLKNTQTPNRDNWFPTDVFPSNVKFTQITCADLDGTYALSEDELIYKWTGSYWQVAHTWHHVKVIEAESDANLDFEDFVGNHYWMNWIDFTYGGKTTYMKDPLPAGLVDLATFGSRYNSGNVIFGLDANHQFYLIDANGARAIPGSPKLTCITSYIDTWDPKTKKGIVDIWALGADGYIYYDQPTIDNGIVSGGNWQKKNKPPVSFTQIAAGNKNILLGLSTENHVYQSDGNPNNWRIDTAAQFKDISVGTDGSTWGIGLDGRAYRRVEKHTYYKISCEIVGQQYFMGGTKQIGEPNLFSQLTWATQGYYRDYIDEWELEIVDGHDFQDINISRPMYLAILRPKGMSHAISALKATQETVIQPYMVFDLTKEDEYVYFHLMPIDGNKPGDQSFKAILMHTGCGMPISYPEENRINPSTLEKIVTARLNPATDEPILTFTYSKT